jgi:hypothetical protein
VNKRAGPLPEISLEKGEISLTGMKISPYKHSYEDRASSLTGLASLTRSHRVIHFIVKSTVRLYEQTGQPTCRDESSKMPLQAIFNNCQNNKIVPSSGMKFFHINRREIHPTYTGCLAKRPSPASI